MVLAALVSGCALDAGESGTLPEEESTQKAESAFDASLFKFGIWVNDDRSGAAGGTQRASAVLKFVDARGSWRNPSTWDCRITVSMPIRHHIYGIIPPELAAQWSADTAVVASDFVVKSRPKWIAALFCPIFAEKMVDLFKKGPKGPIGARVTSP
ncbi:MAG: hypothetical protein ABI134_29910 [Byssovorax sp.]